MDILEAIKTRHSVRRYDDRKIETEIANNLQSCINECNSKSGLNIQLCLDEPSAFDSFMAHYGKFVNVKNYIAIVGKKSKNLDELCGYWGEKIVLTAMQLGLSSCWVGLSYSKRKTGCKVETGEKIVAVIALGYGLNAGVPHRNKPLEALCTVGGEMPEWFKTGMDAALLAPTALNQQKFQLTLHEGNKVAAKAGLGFFTKLDLGIIKCHFEIGAGETNFSWK